MILVNRLNKGVRMIISALSTALYITAFVASATVTFFVLSRIKLGVVTDHQCDECGDTQLEKLYRYLEPKVLETINKVEIAKQEVKEARKKSKKSVQE
jgi:hypothetical protein